MAKTPKKKKDDEVVEEPKTVPAPKAKSAPKSPFKYSVALGKSVTYAGRILNGGDEVKLAHFGGPDEAAKKASLDSLIKKGLVVEN